MKYAWMLKYALLALVLVLLLPLNATAFGYTDFGNGYTYTCTDDDGMGNYRWALRNESYTGAITDWTWSGGTVGKLPGYVLLEADLPLAAVVSGVPRPWYNIALANTESSASVDSTIWWSDGQTIVVPVVMPISTVPEPAGLIVLATAMLMLATRRANRRAP